MIVLRLSWDGDHQQSTSKIGQDSPNLGCISSSNFLVAYSKMKMSVLTHPFSDQAYLSYKVSSLCPEGVMHILCKERIILPPPFHEVLSRENDYGWCWCTISTDELKDSNMILAGCWNHLCWFACCGYNELLEKRNIQWAPSFVTIVDVFGKNVMMGQHSLQKFEVVADCSWI